MPHSLAARLKTVAVPCALAAALTYLSLAVPGRVSAVCSSLPTPVHCPVLAYGFPLPYLADHQGISPVGSVARDPLSLLIGIDVILWERLALDGLFWMLVVLPGRPAWRRWRGDHQRRHRWHRPSDSSGPDR